MSTGDWFTCPVCGEVVLEGALACPACGADDETGWSEDSEYDEVDVPDEVFGPPAQPTRQRHGFFAVVVIGLIVLIVLWAITGW